LQAFDAQAFKIDFSGAFVNEVRLPPRRQQVCGFSHLPKVQDLVPN
jgi:hypothetical protein